MEPPRWLQGIKAQQVAEPPAAGPQDRDAKGGGSEGAASEPPAKRPRKEPE